MRVLPDTSVWVSYFRTGAHGSASELDRLLDGGNVVVCGPVVAELLTGTQERQRTHLWGLLSSLPWAALDPEQWRKVGEASAGLRSRGLSLPLTDVEIAVAAVDASAQLWTGDTDYDRVQQVLPELSLYGR